MLTKLLVATVTQGLIDYCLLHSGTFDYCACPNGKVMKNLNVRSTVEIFLYLYLPGITFQIT